MASNFRTLPVKDLARGIDKRSAPNAIGEGYAEELENVDTNANGSLSKRVGYEGYAGFLPVRVQSIVHFGTKIKFNLDGSIDAKVLTQGPLVVYGKTGTGHTGDFTTDNAARYYSTFTPDVPDTLDAPSGTYSFPETRHNINSSRILFAMAKSTASETDNNEMMLADDVTLSQTDPYDISIDYTVPSDTNVYLYAQDVTSNSGSVYGTTSSVNAGTITSITITAATHNLDTFNLIVQVWAAVGAGDYSLVEPDSVVIQTDGDVVIGVTNSSADTLSLQILLMSATVGNEYSASITGTSTETFTVTSAFFIPAVYEVDGAGEKTKVIPDAVGYNGTNGFVTITNSSGSAKTYAVYWEYVTVSSSSVIVDDTGAVSVDYTDNEAQLTIWGIRHSQAYSSPTANEGHVTHLDTYKASGVNSVVAGLGGNLFVDSPHADAGATYLYGSSRINFGDKIRAVQRTISPFFGTTGESLSATKGNVLADNVEDNKAVVTGAEITSSGVVVYTLSLTNKTGTLASILTGTLGDYLTVTGMADPALNGTFKISSVSNADNTITVENSSAALVGYEETGAMGWAGIFTDTLSFSPTATLEVGDELTCDAFDDLTLTVKAYSAGSAAVSGITEQISVPSSVRVIITRTSAELHVEDADNYVLGDMVSLTGYDRLFRVVDVRPDDQDTVIEIDEAVEISDDESTAATLRVVRRWIPVEAPTTSDNLPATTYYRHFDKLDYNEQEVVRSSPIKDSLFLSNHYDEVYKYDGTNLYQAGLFRWQSQLFAQVDTGTTSLSLSVAAGNVSAVAANKFTVGTGEANQFLIGHRVTHSADNATYTVIGVDTTNDLVYVDAAISGGASGTIKRVKQYKYYFRLNAIDANQNIVASAVTGLFDFAVDLAAAGQIRMRLLAPPAFGNYDYDNWELQVYRTKENTSGPFYLNRNVDVTFNQNAGYIDIFDGTIDDVLSDFDVVNTALKGEEVGVAWTQPPRAKAVTTANNKLLLGNIKDYPEIDITLRKAASAATISAADLAGKILLLRKDKDDAGTTTNMVDRARYEFVNSGAVTLTSISRNATSFTVTKNAHGLVAGNWVYLYHAAAGTDNDLHFAGWWQIASADTNTFTIHFANGYTPDDEVDTYVTATNANDIPVWLGTDGNINQVNGNTISEFTAMLRLSNAINASMRMTDVEVSGYGTFVPWVVANAGSEIGVGRLVLRQEQALEDVFSVVLPETPSTGQWFVQGLLREGEETINASTKLFPSRVVISYENYPEIFDNPYGDQAVSDSVVDINPADGQEVTALFPFFGESVFGTGQVEDVVVVFKSNSIYLLNAKTRDYSKIQSKGLGCTAPYSVAATNNGIMFANESGLYRLNRDQTISYVGEFVERIWQDDVNKDQIARVTGHHFGIGNKYKVSVPMGDDQETNNKVLVYDYLREGRDQEFGAWTVYTNHHATGWANLGKDAYFATTDGQVFRLRNAGDETDYRDDSSAVAPLKIVLRAEDFGLPGERKIVSGVVSHFQLRRSDMNGTQLLVSADLDGNFQDAGTFTFDKTGDIKVVKANSSMPRRKMEYVQLKYTNSTKDEDVILAGVSYAVASIGRKGIVDAIETS